MTDACTPQRVSLSIGWVFSALVMAGCASPQVPEPPPGPRNYVVLLPEDSGALGKVFVKSDKGEQTLDQARQGALISGESAPFSVSAEQLKRDFGSAMAASPHLPVRYYLYFETGGARLTAESQALIATVLTKIAERDNPDVSVIGHSDTVGKAEANAVLAYQRASTIANLLREKGMQAATLSIESHGESNLLVPTPDEAPEPRNRRVEITIR
ncbi:MAG: OmpA family protein [Betaproteobacteria bacterium]|nr:OmpA family protein [Betaproteobacteria bacterium]